jgi:tetratricopeptide (TPR) repeat protein
VSRSRFELTPERWARARTLFEQALGVPVAERAAYLSRHCGSDRLLRETVESLLEADAAAGGILDASLGTLSSLLPESEGGPEVRAGDPVARYRVVRDLGRGGMGVVYLAEDPRLERLVALKFLPPGAASDPGRVDQLMAEARALAALDHPNIATVYEVDATPEGRWFIAMAYYEGETLAQRLARGSPSRAEALQIAIGIARGLSAAHHRGVVHRDVKPGNVMLPKDGEPKLVDFGLASLPGRGDGSSRTARGTVAYMSPEQARGEAADARADVWALGVVLYEMLVGRRPFEGETTDEVLARIQAAALPPLPSSIDRDLTRVVQRALARDPAARFADAGQMLRHLERCARPHRRARWVTVVAAGAALVPVVLISVRSKPVDDTPVIPHVTTRSPAAYRLFEEGIRQLGAGEEAAAYDRLVAALREDSTFALAGFYALMVSDRLGRLSHDSVTQLVMALAPRAPERERLLILTYFEAYLRRSLAAISYAESLTTRYPRDPSARLLAGEVFALRGRYPAAIREARLARDRARERPARSPLRQWHELQAARLLLEAYVWMDSLPAAEREARSFLEIHPGNKAMLGRLRVVLEFQGRTSEARPLINERGQAEIEALQLDHLAIRSGDLDRAERDLSDMSGTFEAGARELARWLRGIGLRTQGRPRAALAIALHGRLPEDRGLVPTSDGVGTITEGIARFESGELERAASIFHSIAAASTDDRPDRKAWWLTHVATAVAAAGDTVRLARLADSIEIFGARSLFGRDQLLHHYVRGLIEVVRGRDPQAVRHLRAAIVSPNCGFTRVNYELGRALLRLGRSAEAAAVVGPALRCATEASNLYITRTELHELLAQAHEAAGQRDSARVHYRIVVSSWARAEPQFQPRRAEAARRLAALGG